MAIVNVSPSDGGRDTARWAIPPDDILNKTPIPRGVRTYGGTAAVLALGAGDETNVQITFTFPTVFVYLPKSISTQFISDDLTTEFSNEGTLRYRPRNATAIGTVKDYAMHCDGPSFVAAVRSSQVFRPLGTWRQWIAGQNGDTMNLFMADISGDTSTAGDIGWNAEFWAYDIEQCLNWPVNTPMFQMAY